MQHMKIFTLEQASVKVGLMISIDKDKKRPKIRPLKQLLPKIAGDFKGAPGFVH